MLILKLLHLLAFVYWLGSDIGVYYTTRYVSDARLSPTQRSNAAQIMLGIDMIPRCCMPLCLATGLHLAYSSGAWSVPAYVVLLGWCLCLAWLMLVLAIHLLGNKATVIARIDFRWRIVVALSLGSYSSAVLVGSWPTIPSWLALKLFLYAACVACGLMIRVQLRPFGAALTQLHQGTAHPIPVGPDVELAISAALSRCKPFVIAIWIMLVISALSGLHWLPIWTSIKADAG
jgi:hypothetical protein